MGMAKTLIFYATPEHECSYLAGKMAQTMFADPRSEIHKTLYTQLSYLGFRRSGSHYYRPHCEFCNACKASRIPVDKFKPNRAQKRIINKNKDLVIELSSPTFIESHYQLYEKYINTRHFDGDMYPPSQDQYKAFIIDCPKDTRFISFKLKTQLVALSVVDYLDDGLSAIYTFFDPNLEKRSLGIFAILSQIKLVKELGLNHLYLGYWIRNCRKMSYKSQFQPLEILDNEHWTDL
jgi:arginine-tRNA-protein transferase